MVGYQVDDGSQIFTQGMGVSPNIHDKNWLFGVPGVSFDVFSHKND